MKSFLIPKLHFIHYRPSRGKLSEDEMGFLNPELDSFPGTEQVIDPANRRRAPVYHSNPDLRTQGEQQSPA